MTNDEVLARLPKAVGRGSDLTAAKGPDIVCLALAGRSDGLTTGSTSGHLELMPLVMEGDTDPPEPGVRIPLLASNNRLHEAWTDGLHVRVYSHSGIFDSDDVVSALETLLSLLDGQLGGRDKRGSGFKFDLRDWPAAKPKW